MCSPLVAVALAAWGLSGCSLLFGEVEQTECRAHVDCPAEEYCTPDSVCRVGARPDQQFDAEPLERDAEPPDAAPPVDAQPDQPLDAAPDLAPDADPSALPFGPLGDCFAGDPQGTFDPEDPPVGDLHVPRAACTPFGRLWTAGSPAGVELAWDLDGDAVAEGRMPVDGGYAVGEGVVFAAAPRDAQGGRQMMRVDLSAGEPVPVRLSPFDHRDPVYLRNRLAFVETVGDALPGVVIVDRATGDDTAEWDCARAGSAQWGPVMGDGFVAWFEQPVGSRLTRVVVLDGPVCAPRTGRRTRVLDAEVPRDARLRRVDGALVWLEPRVDGRGNGIRRWRFDDPGADIERLFINGSALLVDPQRLPPDGPNPVELAAHGQRLAVVSYARSGNRRYVLDTVNFTLPHERAVTRAGQGDDARAPWLSASYLLWAEADRLGIWRVAYERLE